MWCVKKPGNANLVRYQSAFPVSHVFTGDLDILPRQKTRTHGGTYAKHGRKAQKTLMDRRHTQKIHARPTHIQHTDGRHIKHARTEGIQHTFPLPWKQR